MKTSKKSFSTKWLEGTDYRTVVFYDRQKEEK